MREPCICGRQPVLETRERTGVVFFRYRCVPCGRIGGDSRKADGAGVLWDLLAERLHSLEAAYDAHENTPR